MNDMGQAVESDFYFYADHYCLFSQYKELTEIKKQRISNIYDWIVDNRLRIYFCRDCVAPLAE